MEMLDYKKKNYSKEEDYFSLLDKVINCYHYYNYELRILKEVTTTHQIQMYPEESPEFVSNKFIIKMMNDVYDTLTNKKSDYKKNDIEFQLKKNQTWNEKIEEEQQKFRKLFYEMLDFLKVEYNKNCSLDNLRDIVRMHYPYFCDQIYLIKNFFFDNSIDILLKLHFNYEYMKHNYKNHEENMKKYNQYKNDNNDFIEEQDYNKETIFNFEEE